MAENPSTFLSGEQHHESNVARSNTRPVEHLSTPLIPSQKLWAELASGYSDHRIWEEQEFSQEEEEEEEKGQIPVIHQGQTNLKMDTNSGLVMGNMTSTRAEVVGQWFRGSISSLHAKQEHSGYVNFEEPRSRLQHLYHEELSKLCRPDGVETEVILQEEDMQFVPAPQIAQDTVLDAPDHTIEVRVQALLAPNAENMMHSQVPQIVEIQDEDAEIVEEEGFNIDLVDQLAREYLESSTL